VPLQFVVAHLAKAQASVDIDFVSGFEAIAIEDVLDRTQSHVLRIRGQQRVQRVQRGINHLGKAILGRDLHALN
jgi:hypothetical protein